MASGWAYGAAPAGFGPSAALRRPPRLASGWSGGGMGFAMFDARASTNSNMRWSNSMRSGGSRSDNNAPTTCSGVVMPANSPTPPISTRSISAPPSLPCSSTALLASASLSFSIARS
jgi:hypothetical protein